MIKSGKNTGTFVRVFYLPKVKEAEDRFPAFHTFSPFFY